MPVDTVQTRLWDAFILPKWKGGRYQAILVFLWESRERAVRISLGTLLHPYMQTKIA